MCDDCGKDNESINVGISLQPTGEIHSFPFEEMEEKDMVDTLVYPGISIEHFESSSATHYWKNGKIKTIWTSD
jgi:hypothetical protein